MRGEIYKDLALITAIIIQEDILNGTIFQTFDKAYDIAKAFQQDNPQGKNWEGLSPNFDEAVIIFAKQYDNINE